MGVQQARIRLNGVLAGRAFRVGCAARICRFDDRQSRVTVQHTPTLLEKLTRPPFTKSTSCRSGPLSWGA
jgi:hypothetical protein